MTAQTSSLDPLLRRYLGYLRVERGLQPLSCDAYIGDLLQFARFLAETSPGIDLKQASRAQVSGFLADMRGRDLSNRAIARKLSSLRGLYRWLLKKELLPGGEDPTLYIASPGSWKVLPKALAEGTVAAALERTAARVVAETAIRRESSKEKNATPAEAIALRDVAILELLYAGGLRVSELTDLHVASLQLGASRLRVRGKGDKERIVPIGRSAVVALQRYLNEARPLLLHDGSEAEPHLFLRSRARKLTREHVRLIVKAATAGAGTPHMLRHSCATHMVEHGADLRSVQTVLGHADIATTEIYTHLAMGHLRAQHRARHPREQRLRALAGNVTAPVADTDQP